MVAACRQVYIYISSLSFYPDLYSHWSSLYNDWWM